MPKCNRCGRVWRELDDEQGDHPCDCADNQEDEREEDESCE